MVSGTKSQEACDRSCKKKQEARIIDNEFMKIMIDNAKEEEMLVAKLPESPEEENVKDEDIQKRLSMLKRFEQEVNLR